MERMGVVSLKAYAALGYKKMMMNNGFTINHDI